VRRSNWENRRSGRDAEQVVTTSHNAEVPTKSATADLLPSTSKAPCASGTGELNDDALLKAGFQKGTFHPMNKTSKRHYVGPHCALPCGLCRRIPLP